jgi:hypothetical protein
MFEGRVVGELIAAARAVSVAQGHLMRMLSAVTDATPKPEYAPAEVSAALQWTRPTAVRQLELAYQVTKRLPVVGGALIAGEIDLPRASVIVDAVATLPDEAARQLAKSVLPLASRLTTGKLRARLAKLVIEADPETAAKRNNRRVAERKVTLESGPDGCANLFGLNLPADKAVAASRNVSKLARALKEAGDPRSMDQLRADTFLGLLCGHSSGQGSVELTASLPVLAELSRNPGMLAGYGPVVAEIARKVAARQAAGRWTFTVDDPARGETVHGTVRSRPRRDHDDAGSARTQGKSSADVGCVPTDGRPSRDTESSEHRRVAAPGRAARTASRGGKRGRRASAEIAREVRARDRTCRAPGCRVPASACDLDHGIAWANGGPTESWNLTPLCRFHHRAKHEGGWRYRRWRNGRITWRSPLGHTYDTEPEPP